MTPTTKALAVLYACAVATLLYVLAINPAAPPVTPKLPPKPLDTTCQAPEGWTASIEPSADEGWMCVLRRNDGKHTKAFIY